MVVVVVVVVALVIMHACSSMELCMSHADMHVQTLTSVDKISNRPIVVSDTPHIYAPIVPPRLCSLLRKFQSLERGPRCMTMQSQNQPQYRS